MSVLLVPDEKAGAPVPGVVGGHVVGVGEEAHELVHQDPIHGGGGLTPTVLCVTDNRGELDNLAAKIISIKRLYAMPN